VVGGDTQPGKKTQFMCPAELLNELYLIQEPKEKLEKL